MYLFKQLESQAVFVEFLPKPSDSLVKELCVAWCIKVFALVRKVLTSAFVPTFDVGDLSRWMEDTT